MKRAFKYSATYYRQKKRLCREEMLGRVIEENVRGRPLKFDIQGNNDKAYKPYFRFLNTIHAYLYWVLINYKFKYTLCKFILFFYFYIPTYLHLNFEKFLTDLKRACFLHKVIEIFDS